MFKKQVIYFLLSLLLFFSSVGLKAQTACFTTNAIKGCAPFTITVDASCAVYNPTQVTPAYNYDYLNNPSPANFTFDAFHTYTTPGNYRIFQFIGNATHTYFVDVLIVASPDPLFTVQSCIGRNISITITDPIYDKFDINWGDGSAVETVLPASVTNHIYATDGTKSITVTGVFLPNASCGSKTVTPYAQTSVIKADVIDLRVLTQRLSGGSIQLRYNGLLGQNYHIQRSINGGAYTTIATVAGTTAILSYTDNNLNTQTDTHQYRIEAYNDCGTSVLSDEIYALIISATPTNMLNTVSWNGSPTVANFQLTKNAVPVVLTTPTSTTFADNAIACGSSYCYQNTASLTTTTLAGVPHKSYSIDTCITAISTSIPPVLVDVNSTMNGNAVTISWTPAASVTNYSVYVSTNGGAYTLLNQATGNSYTYTVPNINNTYCYQVDYSDLCGNASPKSTSTCPTILEGAINGTTITLNWNAYTGYNNSGVQSYVVQKLDKNGVVLLETNVGLSTTFSETVVFTNPYYNYRIKVIPTNTAFTNSFSNNVLFKFEAELFIPDIFTPNGDGSNDIFYVKSKYVTSYSIAIYSRWGEVVYASTDITHGWNGMDNLVYAIEGAYTYKITATDINNNEFTQTGTVTLVR
jgi:gliding motility-associated-like protein